MMKKAILSLCTHSCSPGHKWSSSCKDFGLGGLAGAKEGALWYWSQFRSGRGEAPWARWAGGRRGLGGFRVVHSREVLTPIVA